MGESTYHGLGDLRIRSLLYSYRPYLIGRGGDFSPGGTKQPVILPISMLMCGALVGKIPALHNNGLKRRIGAHCVSNHVFEIVV
jgi:hypothetical protein